MKNSKVVIVGGGFAGSRTAQDLAKRGFTNVTLIDRKDYFEVTYATLRGVIDPDNYGVRSRIAYKDFLKGTFIQANVTEISDTAVSLEDGRDIEFDYLVIATGTSYPSFPIGKSVGATTLDVRDQEMQAHYEQISSASSIMIIGGGTVGVEFAGELAYYFPNTKIHLMQAEPQLLETLSEKAGRLAHKMLSALNVDIHLNTFLDRQEDGSYKSRSTGEQFNADLVYMCVGLRTNNQMLSKHFADCLQENGRLKVNKKLQVVGKPNIFAVGDVSDVKELKLGYLADLQGVAVAKNIARLAKGKTCKTYRTHPRLSVIPIGPKSGFVQMPFGVSTAGLLLGLKQKDLFISKTFKGLGIDKSKWPSTRAKQSRASSNG